MRHTSPILALAPFAVAAIALGATPACTSRSCTAVYVPSRATIERKITTRVDPSKPIHVELCKNGDCKSGEFVVAATTAKNAGLCRTDGTILFESGCTVVRNADGTFAFQATWVGEETPFNDGDRYRVELTSTDGPLLEVDAEATYSESEPNGEGCGTTKTASL